ncbi:formate dehydrogenase family accessory protein FdhD, partial [mine drainage metagenome]
LAAGFLFTEGILHSGSDILGFEGIDANGASKGNKVTVLVPEGLPIDLAEMQRNFFVNSSCGVCGKAIINDAYLRASRINRSKCTILPGTLMKLPDAMKERQSIFMKTGGIHAAALFSLDGALIAISEDIGRHNAVDKIVGYLLLNELLHKDFILQVSGRAGFEIVQKAAMAGIPVISSVSAPSSLAVETCKALGMTLA